MSQSTTELFNCTICVRILALILFQFFANPEVAAINKCTEDGKVIYQDTPCKNDSQTVADDMARKQHNEVLYQRLDHLAAQGKGLIQQQPAPAQESTPNPAGGTFQRRKSLGEILAEKDQKAAEFAEKSAQNNATSAASLTRNLETTKQTCGDKMIDYPTIGMSDETFRKCTTHARFGGIIQLVISADGEIPIKLYIFPTERAQRVYSIGGVITAIKPY